MGKTKLYNRQESPQIGMMPIALFLSWVGTQTTHLDSSGSPCVLWKRVWHYQSVCCISPTMTYLLTLLISLFFTFWLGWGNKRASLCHWGRHEDEEMMLKTGDGSSKWSRKQNSNLRAGEWLQTGRGLACLFLTVLSWNVLPGEILATREWSHCLL